MFYFWFSAALVFCGAAAWFEWKERRIPDFLNAALVLFSAGASLVEGKQVLFLLFLLFLTASFAFALLLFKLGAWAGGDAKFYAALSSMLPVFGKTGLESAVWLFLASAALLFIFVVVFARGSLGARKIPVSKLSAGLIPADSVAIAGQNAATIGLFSRLNFSKPKLLSADSLRACGLTERQITQLKNARGVKYLLVKQGVAFAPFLIAGFAIAVLL